MKSKVKIFLLLLGVILLPLTALASTGTIDSVSKYAWGSNVGFINFNPTNGNVQVTDSGLSGYIWSDTNGWINLSPTNAGVKNDGTGLLSGYAWGQNTGYISFTGVSINGSGVFTGTATGTLVGAINFDCTQCHVVTTWTASTTPSPTPTPTPTPTPSPTNNGVAYGSMAVSNPILPSVTPVAPIPTPSIQYPGQSPAYIVRLVIDRGTIYFIKNNQRQPISNPGILRSLGFGFNQAVPATAADLAIPVGSVLLPEKGSLVKSKTDQTVYLISSDTRYSFTSYQVFKNLGFSLSSVFIIPNTELQTLPLAGNITNSQAAHLDGVNILDHGTIYYINKQTRMPYSSLAIYNSWNLPNDFSKVVPANNADLSLPVSSPVIQRVLQK